MLGNVNACDPMEALEEPDVFVDVRHSPLLRGSKFCEANFMIRSHVSSSTVLFQPITSASPTCMKIPPHSALLSKTDSEEK